MSDWRRTVDYRRWRAQVIMRDKRCVICNSIKNRHAHHVNSASYFKELRFDIDNGVCLCSACHTNYHCQFNRSYRTKCDEYNFMNFVKLSIHFHDVWGRSLKEDTAIWPLSTEGTLRDFVPHLETRWQAAITMAMAYHKSPDSVVGFVTELATMRYPA